MGVKGKQKIGDGEKRKKIKLIKTNERINENSH